MYMDPVYYFRSKGRQITLQVIMKKSINSEFKYFVIYVISLWLSCLSWMIFSVIYVIFIKTHSSIGGISWFLAILIRTFVFFAPKTLNYLIFKSFNFERTWWRWLQKRVMRTKFDIYVFITGPIPLLVDY